MDFSSTSVHEGISEDNLRQLIEYTHSDPTIQKFTSDLKRFPDKESFDKWKVGATIYTLSSAENKLLGLIWFRVLGIPEPYFSEVPNSADYQVTVAVRLYSEARGKGFLRPFLGSAIEKFKSTKSYENIKGKKGIWLLTAEDNLKAQASFEKFGFKKITAKSGRLLMIL